MSRLMGQTFFWTSSWDSTGMDGAIACVGQTVSVTQDSGIAYLVSEYPGGSSNANGTVVTMPDLRSEAPAGLTPYMITDATYPPIPIVFDDFIVTDSPFIGEVDFTTDTTPPRGWAICDGSLLPPNQNFTLYVILGISFGGNGQTTFALPNLIGDSNVPAGTLPVIATSGIQPIRD
jgi:microcystin-dependent protein